jgi:hypothetical protein
MELAVDFMDMVGAVTTTVDKSLTAPPVFTLKELPAFTPELIVMPCVAPPVRLMSAPANAPVVWTLPAVADKVNVLEAPALAELMVVIPVELAETDVVPVELAEIV